LKFDILKWDLKQWVKVVGRWSAKPSSIDDILVAANR